MPSPPPSSRSPFTRHLAEVGESYVDHAAFALSIAVRCAWTTVLLVIHALFPFLLERAGSEALKRIHADIAARAARRPRVDACEGARDRDHEASP